MVIAEFEHVYKIMDALKEVIELWYLENT
jgi:hypothetical protein